MPVNGGPYPVDADPVNSLIAPAGSYVWLKSRLRVGNTSPVAPDTDAFQRVDRIEVKDPDGVTLNWFTSALDPNDTADTYTSASSDYTGLASIRTIANTTVTSGSAIISASGAAFNANDVGKTVTGTGIAANAVINSIQSATQATLNLNSTASGTVSVTVGKELVGFFAEGYPGAPTGRFAVKVLVPLSAEQTSSSPTRRYTITWRIKKNGGIVTNSETFHVGPVGQVIFGGDFVVAEDVTCGHATNAPTETINCIIAEASQNVLIYTRRAGVSIPSPVPPEIRAATIYEARLLLLKYEISSGRAVNSVSQGGMSLSFQDSKSRIDDLMEWVDKMIGAFLYTQAGMYGWKRPRVVLIRNTPAGGDNAAATNRPLWWQWRDY